MVELEKEDSLFQKIWKQTKWYKEARAKKLKEEEMNKLRAEVYEEIKDDIKEIKKLKIKNEILQEMFFVDDNKEKQVKKNPLKQLGEDFKKSSIGSDEKIRSLLGGRTTTTKKDSKVVDEGKLPSNDKIARMLGRK